MSAEFGLWRIDGQLRSVEFSRLPDESIIEDAVEQDPSILGLDVLVLGRQVHTQFGTIIDLLAIDADGDLVVIELKRDKTPRDVVAQALDYGAWLNRLGHSDITELYESYAHTPFEQAFADRFGEAPPESLNASHQLVVVASALDAATERIIDYLSEQYGVPINAVFFRYFRDGDAEYLARSWLVSPVEADNRSAMTGRRQRPAWNGQDYYVSLGEGPERTWEDCRRYGFISGGQGPWYSNTLKMLSPGDRVFACVPGTGYVGVGEVTGTRTPIAEATVAWEGRQQRLLDLPWVAPNPGNNSDDPDLSEYVVAVDWTKAVDLGDAVWAKGMFANQNTVCRLRDSFTLDKLSEAFEVERS